MQTSLKPLAILAALSLAAVPTLAKQPDQSLPPGLEKKVERGGELPPGWEKKLVVGHILDDDIYAHARVVIPVGDDGIATVEIGGRVLRLLQDTHSIVEILD